MAQRLISSAPNFGAQFQAFLDLKREVSDDVDKAVRGILTDVRERGDAALIALTEKFDRLALTPERLRISDAERADAVANCPPDALEALK
ncbi:MAG: histidinol dehydrogenase, partial [Pseudomonadota bacterium]